MIFIDSPSTNPYFNLALEEYVFERMDQTKRYFMLWQNDNTIVVGIHQNTAEEINAAFVKEKGIRVARRLSGGGAVYHDKGNLNYTIIVDQKDYEDFNFRGFILPVIEALGRLGVKAEFSGRNDILIDGKKFSGNSQYIRHGRILHHGCIMLDSNLGTVADALRVREVKYHSRGIKSVRSRVTTINAESPAPISMKTFRETLTACIRESEDEFQEYPLSAQDMKEIEALKASKYDTWEWNYGKSPAYDVCKEMKFPAGLVTAYIQAKGETIQSIRFYGDFFGKESLKELEDAMVGLRLDGSLQNALEKLDVGSFMNGITAEEIAALLTE